MRFAWFVLLPLAGFSLLAAGCGAPPADPGVVRVVAGENPWGNIASQIGGGHVQVLSLISSPQADPHLFESDVADEERLAGAQVVIVNGDGYDDFLTTMLGSVGTTHMTIITLAKVLRLDSPDANPHLWYDIPRLPRAGEAIEKALARALPRYAGSFRASLHRFDRSLQPLRAALTELRRRFKDRPVAYTERVPGYLLEAAGLRVLTPPGFSRAVEDGTDPSVSDTVAMDRLVSGHRIKALLYNSQVTTPVTAGVRRLAVSSHVPVVGFSETKPSRLSFQAWQLSQIEKLIRTLNQP